MKHPLEHRIAVPLHARKRLIALHREEEDKLASATVYALKQKSAFFSSVEDERRIKEIIKRLTASHSVKWEKELFLIFSETLNCKAIKVISD